MTDRQADTGFLDMPAPSPGVQRIYDMDVEGHGYVMNLSRLWAHLPGSQDVLADLLARAETAASLTFRQKALLVSACASTMGDSYCSLAWGKRLAVDAEAGADVAAGVLRGDDGGLEPSEAALARWARLVARDPNATTATDVQALRDAGFDDDQIFAITAFVALRLAFSTVNDALGARPDRELGDAAPAAVREAVTFGRPVAS
jgi:alkylhydroperoxidase family enzyme